MKTALKHFLYFLVVHVLAMNILQGQERHLADSLSLLIRNEQNDTKKIWLMFELSDVYLKDNVEKAIELAKQAYDLAEKSLNKKEQAQAGLWLARQYYFTSDLNNAMICAVRAKNIAESAGLKLELANSYDAIGAIHYDIGSQYKSSEYFSASLKIYNELKYQRGLGATYCRVGTLYFDQKDFDKAAEYYRMSLRIAQEIRSDEGIASNLNNLAKVHHQAGKFDSALLNYQEALKINLKTDNQYLAGANYLNIGEVYFSLGRYQEAVSAIDKASAIFVRLGNMPRIAKSQILLSKIHMEQGDLSRCGRMAETSLRIGQEKGLKDIIVASAEILTKLYLAEKDSIRAFRYFIIEKQYKDSLFLDEKQKALTRLELQQQFEKNEYNLKIARQKRNVIIFIVSGALLFSLIIIILILKQLKLKARQMEMEKESHHKEIEFKNKELVLNVMSLMKKNEILTELSEKLIKIEEESTTPDSKVTIKKVAQELQKSQDEEIWKEFSLRFKEVHGEFYNTLLQKFPALTPNELKLCAFLRLNLSSKDIAELTGQRISTLETARYRLRQKLGIVNSDINLVSFLSSI